MTASRSGHLPVAGFGLYYEVHGDPAAATAPPLLLIPGAFLGTDSMRQCHRRGAATGQLTDRAVRGHPAR